MTVSHNKTFVFVVLCLICVILYLTIGRQSIPVSNYSGIIDSMEIRVKERDSLIKTLEITRRQDSFTISVLSARLKAIPAKIDSIKQLGEYKSWKLQTELGEIINADAYAICKVKIDEYSYLLFWMLEESTAEACPYSLGKLVFVEIFGFWV